MFKRRRESGDDAIPVKYRWRPTRVWVALILYWFLVMLGGAAWLRLAPEPRNPYREYEGEWVLILAALVFGLCMYTERGRWNSRRRVTFVFLAFAAHVLLTASLWLALEGLNDFASVDQARAFRGGEYFIASIPAVLFAMRQSRWFVELRE
jgi:hypothetical protein